MTIKPQKTVIDFLIEPDEKKWDLHFIGGDLAKVCHLFKNVFHSVGIFCPTGRLNARDWQPYFEQIS